MSAAVTCIADGIDLRSGSRRVVLVAMTTSLAAGLLPATAGGSSARHAGGERVAREARRWAANRSARRATPKEMLAEKSEASQCS